MSGATQLGFAPLAAPRGGTLVVFADENLKLGSATRRLLGRAADRLTRTARAEGFTGKSGSVLTLVAPADLRADRLVVIGLGDAKGLTEKDYLKLGGVAAGSISAKAVAATMLLDLPSGAMKPDHAADVALGWLLRAYTFDRYKTKKKDDDAPRKRDVTLCVADVAGARRAWGRRRAVADGAVLARDLVNEPPNVLNPAEFARRALALKKLGVKVEVLDPARIRRLGMRALLGVAQGSANPPRVVIMQWRGGRRRARTAGPAAFIGKGVTFDTGGISIKPAQGMEDMKGDMAGAACVMGLMHALAARKAKVDAVGVIGLVENMPDGRAQRPGDIVTSMSGQTIEIINTDAEGRLVLADVLHYAAERFKPEFMVDLATLTGAIIIALGHEYAGVFSNDDVLAEDLRKAGEASGERVWRLPLAAEYDKLIDSKCADMKNTGGRSAGSITAAQFLQRFVGKTPWAHIDIAGTGMGSPQTDINKSWASGFGVRLLDRLVADRYER